MRRLTVSFSDADLDAIEAAAKRLDGVSESQVVRMCIRFVLGIERGAAGIDDASHATGTVRAARRSPRNCA